MARFALRLPAVARLLYLPALALAAPALGSDCAFVAATGLDAVVVLDLGTDRLTGILPVGERPTGVAVSPDGRRAWAVNGGEHNVSVLDLASRRALATVPVGLFPARVAVHPDGSRVYVTDRSHSRLSVIDAQSSEAIGTISTQGEGPAGIAITRDGTRAFVANSFSNRVVEIDLEQGQPLGGVGVGELPFGLALTPDDSHVYVANAESGSVSAVRTADRALVATIPVGGRPTAVAVHPGGHTVYASNGPVGSVAVIDTATLTLKDAIELGSENDTELGDMAISPDGSRVLVLEYLFANLFAIDAKADALIGFAPLAGTFTAPEALAVARIAGRCPRSPVPLLTEDAGADDTTLFLERADLLPAAGTLRIGDELVTYEGRHLRVAVLEVARGAGGTQPGAHAADTPARLVGQRGDANCDGEITAADLPALISQAPGDWRPCGGDMNNDGEITPADIPLLVAGIFVSG